LRGGERDGGFGILHGHERLRRDAQVEVLHAAQAGEPSLAALEPLLRRRARRAEHRLQGGEHAGHHNRQPVAGGVAGCRRAGARAERVGERGAQVQARAQPLR
jgi:hypothetical protein